MVNKKVIINRIGDLLDYECGVCPKRSLTNGRRANFEKICGGCKVYEELQHLGSFLNSNDIGEKANKLLKKGEDMTTSDIMYLLENEVNKTEIRAALKMNHMEFNKLLHSLNMVKKKLKNEGEEMTNKKPKVISYKKFEALEQEYENLKKQLEKKLNSKTQGLDYEKRYYELSRDYEKLVHEAEEAEDKVAKLEDENNLLQAEIKSLKDHLDNAIKANDHYFDQCNKQEKELKILKQLAFLHLQKEVKAE